jgi:hypothetical protein
LSLQDSQRVNLFYKELLAISFDETFATVVNVPVDAEDNRWECDRVDSKLKNDQGRFFSLGDAHTFFNSPS